MLVCYVRFIIGMPLNIINQGCISWISISPYMESLTLLESSLGKYDHLGFLHGNTSIRSWILSILQQYFLLLFTLLKSLNLRDKRCHLYEPGLHLLLSYASYKFLTPWIGRILASLQSRLFLDLHRSYKQNPPAWKPFVSKLLVYYPLLEYQDFARLTLISLSTLPCPIKYGRSKRNKF